MHEKWWLSSEPTTLLQLEERVGRHGISLAALYEQEEDAKIAGGLDYLQLQNLVQQMDGISAQLNEAMNILSRLKPKDLSRATDMNGKDFWCLQSALITAICLTLLLDASLSIHELLDRLTKDTQSIEDDMQHAPFIMSQQETWHEELGWRVVTAAAYMTSPEMGFYGALRAIFPLWMMINILPRDYAAYGRAEGLYVQMITKRKIRHPLDFPQKSDKPNKRLVTSEA